MYFLYSLALALALVAATPWWAWQMLTKRKYRAGLGERLGRVPARIGRAEGAVWIHAVSVGEVLAMGSVIEKLRARWPERRVVISTTTLAGQKLARTRFGEANVFYFPLDFAFAIATYLGALRPSLVILAETEFWPNFLRLAKSSGARVAVINARISDRSLPRYRRFRGLLRRVLENVDLFLAQSEEDARRLESIGAPAGRVRAGGNLKFDVQAPKDVAITGELRAALEHEGARPVIVAGSTLVGEEAILIGAFRRVLEASPKAVMILAPRHPERFDAVAELLQASGLMWRARSQWLPVQPLVGGVLLLDTIGELASLYSLATLAFVGGSLVRAGGHNVVEPARWGVPVLVGPHTENFRDIVTAFQRARALRVVSPLEIKQVVVDLLASPQERAELGRRAAEVVAAESGATERTIAALAELIEAKLPAMASREAEVHRA